MRGHLFDMKEVFDSERNRGAMNWRVIVHGPIVGHVRPYCESHWLRLKRNNTKHHKHIHVKHLNSALQENYSGVLPTIHGYKEQPYAEKRT